jgi:hypothetical protein
MIDIVMVRGTGEPFNGPNNMLRGLSAHLDPEKFGAPLECSYPASIGVANRTFAVTGPSEGESVLEGVENLANLIRSTPNKVGVLGYSLGAEVVSRFLEAQGRGEYADCELAFSACVANPLRREGDSIDAAPPGFGINGQHNAFPERPHFECANPDDAITSCPEDSPLRGLADVVSAFGLAAIGGWGIDLRDRLLERRWQPVTWGWWRNPLRTWDLYEEAADDVAGYLGGQHTTEYVNGGYCERLAMVINRCLP